MVAQGIGDVLLIGSAHSAATLRIKAFLTRNGHPFSTSTLTVMPTCGTCSIASEWRRPKYRS